MGVVVDTSVWVEYFRRSESPEATEVNRLINSGAVILVGAVYSELLQGARNQRELELLDDTLKGLPHLDADRGAWERAGRLLFDLRRQGTPIPLIDGLIAALALRHGHMLFTLDSHFRQVPGLVFHEPVL